MSSRQPAEIAADILHSLVLVAKVWNGDEIPSDWSKDTIIPVLKKIAVTYGNNLLGYHTVLYQVKSFVRSLSNDTCSR